MMRTLVRLLAQSPVAFDGLRWILEGGYANHRKLIHSSIGQLTVQVLDIGCGTGIYATCFSADKYTGVDISPAYVDRCKRRCPKHTFQVMDATQLDFGDATFGAAMISGVLHHLDDDLALRVCREVQRVLTPGGKLLVCEDIPTTNRWNLIGSTIHRLDLGEHIRAPEGYRDILTRSFTVNSTELLRSGVMDYVAFRCTKDPARGDDSLAEAVREGTAPAAIPTDTMVEQVGGIRP